jgi:hypothetical protein
VVTQTPEENVNVFSKWLVSGGIWEWLGIYLMGVNRSGGVGGAGSGVVSIWKRTPAEVCDPQGSLREASFADVLENGSESSAISKNHLIHTTPIGIVC